MNLTELENNLGQLRGIDFENAEALERASGNNYPELSFSKKFQARLAALALGVSIEEIKNLPLASYAAVTQRVFNFLFSTSGDETPVEKSEI